MDATTTNSNSLFVFSATGIYSPALTKSLKRLKNLRQQTQTLKDQETKLVIELYPDFREGIIYITENIFFICTPQDETIFSLLGFTPIREIKTSIETKPDKETIPRKLTPNDESKKLYIPPHEIPARIITSAPQLDPLMTTRSEMLAYLNAKIEWKQSHKPGPKRSRKRSK